MFMNKKSVTFHQWSFIQAFMLAVFISACNNAKVPDTKTIPEPEFHNTCFAVSVDNEFIPVHTCKVAPGDAVRRWKAMDDPVNSKLYYDTTAFASFNLPSGGADIMIHYPQKINTAKVLPASAAISASIQDNFVRFRLHNPANLTIEINGDPVHSLHLFANPPETDLPNENDPNVIFFGPGTHEVSYLPLTDNQTVYISEGAVVKAVIDPNEDFYYQQTGLKGYGPFIIAEGRNIKIRGRGIIDCSAVTTHGKNTIIIKGENISVEGIIITNPALWTIPIYNSENITVKNVKIIGHRANSDGIDICSSHNVTVDGCFIRTLDDLIVVKTLSGHGTAGDINVRNCVLWNQVAHALSIGAEITSDIENVRFENCDVIHDIGREYTLRIYHTDAATVSNITFENIRIEESSKLMSLWIGEAAWSSDAQRGNIRDITFNHINASDNPLQINFKGYDANHKIDGVSLNNITLNNAPLSLDNITQNEFVTNISIRP